MKLNPDCIRDILLKVEEVTDSTNVFTSSSNAYTLIAAYGENAFKYHLEQCNHHGFFVKYKVYVGGNIVVHDLSPEGHSFLAEIRSSKVWDKTKEVCLDVGVDSIKALASVAAKVAASLLAAHLGM